MNEVKHRGLFITVEGVEGCGKTTNIAFMKDVLQSAGVSMISTREPGGTPLAESIRALLLANRSEAVDEHAELLMVFAARAQHLSQVIVPALTSGQWVLCDRFTDATYAYQGGGRNLSIDSIATLESLVQKGRQPDKTFFLDLDVEVGMQRAAERGELDRFEREQMSFFERVRQGYWDRINKNPERYIVIDASYPLAQVQEQIGRRLRGVISSAAKIVKAQTA